MNRNVIVDQNGDLHCRKCGNTRLRVKASARYKRKKHLRCSVCGARHVFHEPDEMTTLRRLLNEKPPVTDDIRDSPAQKAKSPRTSRKRAHCIDCGGILPVGRENPRCVTCADAAAQ
jgi:hypothetical protein